MLTKDNESDISRIVVDAAFKVHTTLGPGLLESAYEACLFHELLKRGLNVKRQVTLPVQYDDLHIDAGYRLDLIVEDCLIIELKSVEKLLPIRQAQMLTYLKLSNIKTGLLINFNVKLIKDGIKRLSL
jgi:GxxExxY protein